MSYPDPASRMAAIAPFRVMEILARAQAMQKAGRDLVHMEVGEPDFPAPEPVNRAAAEALQAGLTHYTPALGLPALREAIAAHYRRRFGLRLDPQRVIVTPGASGALQLLLGVLVEPDDRVGVQDPGYPCNRHMIELYGGRAVPLPQRGDRLEASEALAPEGLAGLMLASPANPTGEVLSPELLAQVRRRYGGAERFLLVDEIYQGLQYEGEVRTALEEDGPGLFVVNSFSKYFGMTGYRVGWAVVPERWVEPLDRLAQNLFLAPPTIAQHAALAAFEPETGAELERRRAIFRERRDRLYAGLRELGFQLSPEPPAGAFYLYAGLPCDWPGDGETFCRELLEAQAVAVTPGIDFGDNGTVRRVRFAYTTELERIELGLQRIAAFLG